jgi:hypothetical protein
VAISGVEPGKKVSGTISITPSGKAAAGHLMGTFELFVDGRLVSLNTKPGQTLTLNTSQLADGYHELRIVGAHADPIETQGRAIVPILVDNHGASLEFSVSPRPGVSFDGKLKVQVRQPGATAIAIRQNSREVGRVKGESGELEIPAATLGRGPIALQAFSEGAAATASAPVQIQVN